MSHTDAFLARFRISSQHLAPIFVAATDWMSALGTVLHQLGRTSSIHRLACERMPNGDIIANDLTNRHRYVIQQLQPIIADDYEDEVTELRL